MKKILIFFILIFGLTCHAWAEKGTIKIGVSLSLTGKYASMGNMQEKAYRLWEEQINAKGGVLGNTIQIIIKDDQSDKKNVANIYQNFINQNQVNFVFGPYSSELTHVAAPIANKYQWPMLTAGASADSIWQKGYQYVFGMWTPASRYVVGFLEMLVAYDLDNIAILTADDAFSYNIAVGTRDWAERLGIKVKYFKAFEKGTRDLTPFIKDAKSSGAQILITTGHYNESVDTKKALKAINWKPKLFLATVGPTFSKYYEDLQKDAEGDCSVAIWEPHPQLKYPGSQQFANDFKTRYGVSPTYHAATAFAAGELLAQAIEDSGGIEKETIRSTLSALNTYSIIGRYGVDRTGLQVKRFPLCIQWQNGKKEILWPEELSTAEPIFSNE